MINAVRKLRFYPQYYCRKCKAFVSKTEVCFRHIDDPPAFVKCPDRWHSGCNGEVVIGPVSEELSPRQVLMEAVSV